MEFEWSRHVQTSRIACEVVRADDDISNRGSRHKTKGRVSGSRALISRGSRGRFHIVAIETETGGIEQIGCDHVVLFDSHHLTKHGVVKELGRVLVGLTLRRFVEQIGGEDAVFVRKIVVRSDGEKIFQRVLECTEPILSRIAAWQRRWQDLAMG